MPIQKTIFNIKGMTRDMAVSKFTPELAFENKNLRIVATEDNTSFGLVNEKGTLGATIDGLPSGTNFISGTPIGQEVINDTLILFTTDNEGSRVVTINGIEGGATTIPNLSGDINIEDSQYNGDHIYKFKINSTTGNLTCTPLYHGDLGFDPGCPIESIGVYENEELQKVYWVDGIHQPRVINIAATQEARGAWNNNSFNFVRRIEFTDPPTVTRNEISYGSFAQGVIQYCFTFYSLYGAQSNIVYTTPLYYVSHSNRGASPEDIVSCSFNINIPYNFYKDVKNSYDYIRIYSIHRTSIDATPIVRKVADLSIKGTNSLSYVDIGVSGESIDPTELFYIGGDPIIVNTITQKDNTLFLGDITLGRNAINTTVKTYVDNYRTNGGPGISITTVPKFLALPDNANVGHYSYTNQLSKNNSQITYFKSGEYYRLGFQAQHYTGKWSDVIYVNDYLVPLDSARIANTTVGGVAGINLRDIKVTITETSGTPGNHIIRDLVEDGYIKIRPVVVFPSASDRSIICQGVLCPTVYNVEDRYNNAPFAQSSWFFRPNAPSTVTTPYTLSSDDLNGRWAEFRHNKPIPTNTEPNSEIQCICVPCSSPCISEGRSGSTSSPDNWVGQYKESYFIDQSIVTMHSPDIEFGDDLKTLDAYNLNLRIVGYVPFDACYSDIDIQATTPSNYANGHDGTKYKFQSTVAPGFVKTQISATTAGNNGWRCLLSGPMWFDEFSNYGAANNLLLPAGFIVYPWHRNGALNNTRAALSEKEPTSMLKQKKMSLTRFSKDSIMLPGNSVVNVTDGVSNAVTFNSDQVTMIKLKAPANSGMEDIVYYGNIDKVLTIHSLSIGARNPGGTLRGEDVDTDIYTDSSNSNTSLSSIKNAAYPIVVVCANPSSKNLLNNVGLFVDQMEQEANNVRVSGDDYKSLFTKPYTTLDTITTPISGVTTSDGYGRYIYLNAHTHSTDPISIKYKSTPHIVMTLNYPNSITQRVLPRMNDINTATITRNTTGFFWKTTLKNVSQQNISVSSGPSTGYLWLGELYRNINTSTLFGGNSQEAIESNNWIPAGEPVSLISNNNPVSSVNLIYSQGDTYYQRYDCLKTYPFTLEDQNSVVDILSFMCETRINIDGRYDRNRGKLSNLYTTPSTYNLFNPVYSQLNNFFNYRGFNTNKLSATVFPNTITWSKTKTMGETVDTWTNITLASTLDLDGDKGRIRALRRYDNNLLAFQDRGVSQILYNESVQISSTAGVPIEIANSGKVSGKRYISNHIGCVNKWSICSAPTGLYFIDDIGKDIYLFNGQLNNISDKYGFHSWVIGNFPNIKIWNPRDFATGGEITYYDKVNGDVLFITGNTALALSEPLGNFSSFYSYEKTPYFATLGDRGIMWHKDESIQSGEVNYNKYRAWWYRAGYYNSFFGVYKPFYTTIIANEHPTEDKIFNNLEYRGDTFDINGNYLPANTFDRLETWNEYQSGSANLSGAYVSESPLQVSDVSANLRKKFRIWRADIPRNTESLNYKRDRMRNPWLYIKLSKETQNNYKTILHDLVVYYYE